MSTIKKITKEDDQVVKETFKDIRDTRNKIQEKRAKGAQREYR